MPRGKLVVITGVSGSGKSTLAFDIVYAEGQRRYVESLSAYARQYIRVLPRPDVEHVEGLPPTVAIEQRVSRPGANSTVATTTELWHYLRLLYTRLGEPHCPTCDIAVKAASPDAIVEALLDIAGAVSSSACSRRSSWRARGSGSRSSSEPSVSACAAYASMDDCTSRRDRSSSIATASTTSSTSPRACA